MLSQFTRIWHVLRTVWWAIVVVLAVILFIVGGVWLSRRRKKGSAEDDVIESFVATAANRVKDAVTDVKVETAIIKTDTDMKKEALQELKKEPDGQKRREKLAELLQKSL